MKPSNNNATSEKVLSSNNAENMLIYLIYIPLLIVVISIFLCFTSYTAKKKLANLNPDKQYIHMKEPNIFIPNKVSDFSDTKIYKSAFYIYSNDNANSNGNDNDNDNIIRTYNIDLSEPEFESVSDSDSDSET